MTLPNLISAGLAAEYLGVSRDWVMRKARAGEVPSIRIGRRRMFIDTDLASYVESRRTRDPWARSPRSAAARRRSAS